MHFPFKRGVEDIRRGRRWEFAFRKPQHKQVLDLTGAPHDGFTRSYWSLCGGLSFWHGGTNPKNAGEALIPTRGYGGF